MWKLQWGKGSFQFLLPENNYKQTKEQNKKSIPNLSED